MCPYLGGVNVDHVKVHGHQRPEQEQQHCEAEPGREKQDGENSQKDKARETATRVTKGSPGRHNQPLRQGLQHKGCVCVLGY